MLNKSLSCQVYHFHTQDCYNAREWICHVCAVNFNISSDLDCEIVRCASNLMGDNFRFEFQHRRQLREFIERTQQHLSTRLNWPNSLHIQRAESFIKVCFSTRSDDAAIVIESPISIRNVSIALKTWERDFQLSSVFDRSEAKTANERARVWHDSNSSSSAHTCSRVDI